jgi:hypothetical protein
MSENAVRLIDLINEAEIINFREYVTNGRLANSRLSTHNLILKWLDSNDQVMRRAYKAGLIKSYFAYMLEYHLATDIP